MQVRRVEKAVRNQGALLPLAAVAFCVMLVFAAFSIDLGYLCLAKSEAQNAADAAALAAANDLFPDPVPQTAIKLPLALPIYQPTRPAPNIIPAKSSASTISASNRCAGQSGLNLLESDLQFLICDNGLLVGPPPTLPVLDGLLTLLNLRAADDTFVNACQVTVRRDALANRPVSLFMAPALGIPAQPIRATATAAIFRAYGASAGERVLPIAMDITIWNALRFTNGELNAVTLMPLGVDLDSLTLNSLLSLNGILGILNSVVPLALLESPVNILDGYTYRRGMSTVATGPDGINEVVLLADQLTVVSKLGILGNLLGTVTRIPSLFVTLETGIGNDSAPNASRLNLVIREGLSPADIARLSGRSDGQLWLPFSTRCYFEIPDACEAELKAMIGRPCILPLYATLPGTVNKVTDVLGMAHSIQIVGWGGVVITEVNLQGPIRYINVQPAIYARNGMLPAQGANASHSASTLSDGVYCTARLIRDP